MSAIYVLAFGSILDLLLVSFVVPALSMFSKSRLPRTSDVEAPHVALQEDLEDLYADNLISANRCQTLLGKAHTAGATQLKEKRKEVAQEKCCQGSGEQEAEEH